MLSLQRLDTAEKRISELKAVEKLPRMQPKQMENMTARIVRICG